MQRESTCLAPNLAHGMVQSLPGDAHRWASNARNRGVARTTNRLSVQRDRFRVVLFNTLARVTHATHRTPVPTKQAPNAHVSAYVYGCVCVCACKPPEHMLCSTYGPATWCRGMCNTPAAPGVMAKMCRHQVSRQRCALFLLRHWSTGCRA